MKVEYVYAVFGLWGFFWFACGLAMIFAVPGADTAPRWAGVTLNAYFCCLGGSVFMLICLLAADLSHQARRAGDQLTFLRSDLKFYAQAFSDEP